MYSACAHVGVRTLLSSLLHNVFYFSRAASVAARYDS